MRQADSASATRPGLQEMVRTHAMLCSMSTKVPMVQDRSLLDALLDSWDRNNTILVNLLHALSEHGMDARAMDSSPTVAQLFTHVHYVRLVFVVEDAPEFGRPLPNGEWAAERDRDRIADMLNE